MCKQHYLYQEKKALIKKPLGLIPSAVCVAFKESKAKQTGNQLGEIAAALIEENIQDYHKYLAMFLSAQNIFDIKYIVSMKNILKKGKKTDRQLEELRDCCTYCSS